MKRKLQIIQVGDSLETIREKARANGRWVEPPHKMPTISCRPRDSEFVDECIFDTKNFKALRKMGVCYWSPKRQEWMLFADDWTPQRWSGIPKFPKKVEASGPPPPASDPVERPVPAPVRPVQGRLF